MKKAIALALAAVFIAGCLTIQITRPAASAVAPVPSTNTVTTIITTNAPAH